MAPERLRLVRADWDRIIEHLQRCLPLEGCGLLGGRGDRVRRVWLIENAARSPVRYFMEPRQLVAALTQIEDDGLDLLAAFHSHPDGPDGVSATDVREWQYPEAALAVWRPGPAGWSARAFVVSGEDVREIPLTIDDR